MNKKYNKKKEKDIPVQPSSEIPLELAGIDVKDALKRLNVDVEFFKQSLMVFSESYSNIIAKIKKALKRKNKDETRQLLHTLRGAAINIGANEVEAAAKKLGDAVKSEKDELKPLVNDLEIALNLVLESIQSIKPVKKD